MAFVFLTLPQQYFHQGFRHDVIAELAIFYDREVAPPARR